MCKRKPSTMACVFPVARCISSMKNATRDRSSFKPWCRFFPTTAKNPSRRAFSNKSTAFTRGQSSSMPKAGCASKGGGSSSTDLPKTTTGSCFSPRSNNEKGETTRHLDREARGQRWASRLSPIPHSHRALLGHARVSKFFVHCVCAHRLFVHPVDQRFEVGRSGSAHGVRHAFHGCRGLLSDRHVFQSFCPRNRRRRCQPRLLSRPRRRAGRAAWVGALDAPGGGLRVHGPRGRHGRARLVGSPGACALPAVRGALVDSLCNFYARGRFHRRRGLCASAAPGVAGGWASLRREVAPGIEKLSRSLAGHSSSDDPFICDPSHSSLDARDSWTRDWYRYPLLLLSDSLSFRRHFCGDSH